jgi:hypothetical protein
MSDVDSARVRLEEQLAELTEALVAGAPMPPGFDERLFAVARSSLLNKRAGEVAHTWPRLAAALGPQWRTTFREWAADRPPRGSLCDGFDFARYLAVTKAIPPGPARAHALAELAAREGYWRYDGTRPPRRRKLPGFANRWIGRLRTRVLTGRHAA